MTRVVIPSTADLDLFVLLEQEGCAVLEIDGVQHCPDPVRAQAIVDSWVAAGRALQPLTRAQFFGMLALSGYEDIWGALETLLRETDIMSYAALRALKESTVFDFADTVRFLEQFGTALPEGQRVPQNELMDLWRFAQDNY